MAKIESAEAALQPYLNPDYWSGHSIGYGPSIGRNPAPLIFGLQLHRSRRTLEQRLARMEKAVPIKTYTNGQTFNAEDYELGTIVIFRDESLVGKAEDMPLEAEALKGQQLPSRPVDVSPSFGDTSTTQTITDGNIFYFTAARWGIVTVNKTKQKILHSISTGVVDRIYGGKVLVDEPSLRADASPIPIGETRHYAGPHTETLARVNILDIVAYGEAEKKKMSIRGLAARLALGNRGH